MILSTRNKIALASAASRIVRGVRAATGREASASVRRKGLCWELDLSEGIDFSIYLTGSFEGRTIRAYEKRIRPGDVVADIGANIGAHTLHFAKMVGPSGRVVAFEPTARMFGKLRRNIKVNPALEGRIVARQLMLSSSDDGNVPEAVFSSWPLKRNPDAHPHHLGVAMSTAGASASTLDRALAAAGVDRVDFVKMDVDGYEMDVLRGAFLTLERCRPEVVMELAPYTLVERGEAPDAPVVFLEKAGYSFRTLAGKPIKDIGRQVNELPEGYSLNILAAPR